MILACFIINFFNLFTISGFDKDYR